MNKLFLLLLAVFTAGCSSSYVVSSPPGDDVNSTSEFNNVADGKRGFITLRQETSEFPADGIHATSDSLFWNDKAGRGKSTATAQVKEVVFISGGVWEGIGWGFLGGAAAGFLYATAWVPAQHSNSGLEQIGYIVFPAGGGLLGGMAGGIYGGVTGHQNKYTFHKDVK